MTLTVGKYTFNAWLRRGIGRTINETDTLGAGNGTVKERATVPIDVAVNAHPVHKDFALVGPGDIVGIRQAAVVRVEPYDWVTDFEPNYLAFIEFYDEDLPWRYTPARAAGDRLRPWLALAVLEDSADGHDGEFSLNEKRQPLPSIVVTSMALLPPPAQIWAWAHVHTNESFPNETDFEQFLASLETPDHPNADRIISRLTSPRRLKANTAYAAFVVPAFETGRLAGLGQDPSGVFSQQPAWTDAPSTLELPVFYRWRFRTGENEDFESMVNRLEPRVADSRVGIRDMDGEKPGWGLTAGTDIGQIVPTDVKQTVIGLEGALKAPSTTSRPIAVDTTRLFFDQLQSVLNFPEQRRQAPDTAALPVVAPPIYGEYHAQQHTVNVSGTGWVDVLNRDPRHRVSAGFGVRVVRDNHEGYLARAWSQVEAILKANDVIRLTGFAMRASETVYVNFAKALAPARMVTFFAPVLRKVRGSPTTLQHMLEASTLPASAVSGAMRRLVRPRGAVGRRLAAKDAAFTHAALVKGMAAGDLTAAPSKRAAVDLMTDAVAVAKLTGSTSISSSASVGRWFVLVLLFALFLFGLVTGAWLIALIGAALLVAGYVAWRAGTASAGAAASGGTSGSQQAPAGPASITDAKAVGIALAKTPLRSAFAFVERDPVAAPRAIGATLVTTSAVTTSSSATAVGFSQVQSITPGGAVGETVEAHTFRIAAAALESRLSVGATAQPRATFDLANAARKLSAAVDPLTAFPRRVASQVRLSFDPAWLLAPEHLVPAMAYPDFDDPMYERLRDISSQLLLPNLELIPPNSVTLLESNAPFIEAYLVGLNYEFGKELLWREYPTDQRGSYFRQFWNVRGIIADDTSGESPAAISEQAKDITPLDTWSAASLLGAHRNPLRPPGEQVVLTIRGDLLKKYPHTLVYAQKAHVARDANGNPQPSNDPVIATVASDADIQAEIKFPVFQASVDPDIRLFGFDLSVEQARGVANPRLSTDDWGYYFVIQQLPGEPRFGMDLTFAPDDDPTTPITWNDLAWTLFPDGQRFIDVTVPPQSFAPAGPGESLSQWGNDSARMAAILLQEPVMIALHAKEMLAGLS